MTQKRGLAHSLRNTSVRDFERALLRDGFLLRRQKGSSQFYAHPDGRITDIHYHHGRDTLPRGTLASVLAATRWTEEDARRLGQL